MKNILIVTGGSGGHVVPSTSLFEHLKNKFSVKMVSDLRGSKYINTEKFKYELIDVPNLFLKPYLLPINIFKYFLNIFQSPFLCFFPRIPFLLEECFFSKLGVAGS